MKKKKIAIIASIVAFCIIASVVLVVILLGNKEQPPIVENPEQIELTFQSELSEKQLGYPLSTGRVFYVAAKGNDANDGLSPSTAIKSIKKANQLTLQAGDTIAFKCGDVFTGATLEIKVSGEENNPITICSYGEGNRPKILAQQVNGINFQNVSNLVIRDLEIIVNGQERVSENTPPQVYGIHGLYTKIYNENGERITYKNIYVMDNLIYGSATTSSSGVRIHSEFAYRDASGNPIQQNDLLENVHLRRNTVHTLGMAGIFTDSWFNDDNFMNANPYLYKNVYLNENTTYNIAQIPLYLECCYFSEINRNYVYDSAMGVNGNAWLNIGQCGIMTLGCYDTEVMYNEIYNVHNANIFFDGMGIDIDWNCKRVNVQYNHTYDCTGSGIGTMANVDCTILDNRVENNDCAGKQMGQIDCIDFTNRKSNVPNDMHVVRNILIKGNLIVNDKDDRVHFGARNNGGDGTLWSGNVFEENHLISTTDSNDTWINIDEVVGWYKFANNKYYKNDTSKFKVFDLTDSLRINTEDGAVAFDGSGFSGWQKRDLGATYEARSNEKPSAVKGATASYSNGTLTLNWNKSSGDLWRYNLYLTENPESFDYTKMIGKTVSEQFSYQFDAKGVYYLIIQPESNQGIYGTHAIVKITLN